MNLKRYLSLSPSELKVEIDKDEKKRGKMWRFQIKPLPNETITGRLANLCVFECIDGCKITMSSWTETKRHIKACKKLCKSDKNYDFNLKYVVKRTFHKCHMCGKVYLCDKKFMNDHLGSLHRKEAKTTAQYAKKCGIVDETVV